MKAGFVLVRNPYNASAVTRYKISPDVVDVLSFCTKNPAPMFDEFDLIKPFGQYWFVTITPYGKDIEPNVPDKHLVMENFKKLSEMVGENCVGWRYDPIFISERYSLEYHFRAFEKMCATLAGATHVCVISFIDLYEKVKRNFLEVREVSVEDRIAIGKRFAEIGARYGIEIRGCAEGRELERFGVNCDGCATAATYEKALGCKLNVSGRPAARKECACIIGCDIGAYNTCAHFCRYCYANYDRNVVRANMKKHDENSPFLIGNSLPGDIVHEAKQKSFRIKESPEAMQFDIF